MANESNESNEANDTASSGRYEIGELFDDMNPETEMVCKAIGVVFTLLVLGVLFGWVIQQSVTPRL